MNKIKRDIAVLNAMLATQVYYNKYDINDFILISVLPHKLGFVLLHKPTSAIHIVLRGTMYFEDFITDADMIRTRTEFGDIHEGFWNDYNLVLPYIVNPLKELGLDKYIIYVTGHSMGAAIAALIAYKLSLTKFMFTTEIVNIPIALPHVSDDTFVALYSKAAITTCSIANVHDLIPDMPAGLGYVQLVKPVYVDFQHNDVVLNHKAETYVQFIKELPDEIIIP